MRAMPRIDAVLWGLVAATASTLPIVAAQAIPPIVIPILAAPPVASVGSSGGHGALEGNVRPLPYEVGLNPGMSSARSEEHTLNSSHSQNLVCRLLLEKKKSRRDEA